jgi:hypothetical protein
MCDSTPFSEALRVVSLSPESLGTALRTVKKPGSSTAADSIENYAALWPAALCTAMNNGSKSHEPS